MRGMKKETTKENFRNKHSITSRAKPLHYLALLVYIYRCSKLDESTIIEVIVTTVILSIRFQEA